MATASNNQVITLGNTSSLNNPARITSSGTTTINLPNGADVILINTSMFPSCPKTSTVIMTIVILLVIEAIAYFAFKYLTKRKSS